MKKFTFPLLLAALLLTACSGAATPAPASAPIAAESPRVVTAEGTLLPAPAAELAFAQPGIVAEILVTPGDKVAADDALARLDGIETVRAELAAAQLEETLAKQAVDAMQRNALLTGAGAHQALRDAQKAYETESSRWNLGSEDDATDLELAIDDYVLNEKDYRDAKTELDRFADREKTDSRRVEAQEEFDKEKENLAKAYADLLEEIPSADDRLDEDQIALLKSIAALEIARQGVDRLENGIDSEIRSAAQARLQAATAHVAAAEDALSLYELRAPFAGTVTSLDDLTVGEAAPAGLPVIFLADTSTWTVETTDLAEVDIARVAIGDTVTIRLDAFPGEEFGGKVTAIDPVGREHLGDMTYRVTITLDDADPRFYWNMTATVNIETQ
jgi:multidrug resistance efflux pump